MSNKGDYQVGFNTGPSCLNVFVILALLLVVLACKIEPPCTVNPDMTVTWCFGFGND